MPDFLTHKSIFSYKYINAQECLNILTEDEKQELIIKKSDISFVAGETIIKRGMLANNVLYITEGLAKIEFINDSKPFTIGIVQPHSFIGIVCCFAFEKFDFTATALTKSKVSFIPMDLMKTFIKENGEFALSLIEHMSGISNGIIHRISSLSQKNIEGAISILLLDFMKIYKSNKYILPMNRAELANMLGYSKESVINTLSKFNKEKIISVSDRKIEILNLKTLEKISKIG